MEAQAAIKTVKIYGEQGDGNVSTAPYPGPWDVQHSSVVGRNVIDENEYIRVKSGAFYTPDGLIGIVRGYTAFDTTAIPEESAIISASLGLYITSVFDDYDDEYGYVNVVQGFQSSHESLSANDINLCGDSLTNPQKGSLDIDISGIAVDDYLSITLNNSARNWISKGAYTKLCIREGHDLENIETVKNINDGTWNESWIYFASADAADSNTHPYLEITYDDGEIEEDFPLYTQIESPHPSLSETAEWADDYYAKGGMRSYWCGNTIGECGCAITSLVMIARSKGIEVGVDGEDINPGNLNNWLNKNQGYNSAGSLIWATAVDYFGEDDGGEINTPFRFINHKEKNMTVIDSYVSDEDKFVIGHSAKAGHYLILTAVLDSGYSVKDPFWYETKTTNDETAVNVKDYNDKINKAVLYKYHAPQIQKSLGEIIANSPVELLLENGSGGKTGSDGESVFAEIENVSYSDDDYIRNPASTNTNEFPDHYEKRISYIESDDEYILKVTGVDEGSYTLTFSLRSSAGKKIYQEFMASTTAGQVDIYHVNAKSGEVEKVEKIELDRDAFIALIEIATENKRSYVQRFFERAGHRIFNSIERDRVRLAKVQLRIFKKLLRYKWVRNKDLNEAIEILEERLR